MRVKGVIEEDFLNFREPAMFINTCFCDFKCCTEYGLDVGVCQNAPLAQAPIKDIPDDVLFQHFMWNPITKAVVVGGLEPIMQVGELAELIFTFRRNGCQAPFVIYTGYYPEEIEDEVALLKQFCNIIVKFGRFIPNKPHRFDETLGIELASDNQYAERIS